ncbi:S-layer homology domain-containing protein [Phosphitispora fastidiosa]|uniref:S-layer homology domain-containing protein n=1 Tax=Phosphitispora fastidiosa TaxID=2837202 RepID=UPI001E350692|nr:S-layer homology domain-containing protein [Phosphitispora fastidiosa]MBU7005631.1 hypothetical protein [Phosphitispora fastidiosa]
MCRRLKVKNLLLVSVILAMLVLMMPITSFAASDISHHWAKGQIEEWSAKGLIKGYSDNTFRPDNNITRAEFFTLINKVFGFKEKAVVSFSDVSGDVWYYDEIAKAVAAGYVGGYPDGSIRPQNNITRQEAALVVVKAFGLSDDTSSMSSEFKDSGQIGDWARNSVAVMQGKGFIGGYPDGTFGPEKNIKRAETVTILGKASGEIINQPGTYSSETKGNLVVNSGNVILKDMVIAGDLYLAEGIGNSGVTLDGVTVKGKTFIRGGTIEISETATISTVAVKAAAKVTIAQGAKITAITVSETAKGADIDVWAETTIEVKAENVVINNTAFAAGTTLTVAAGGNITITSTTPATTPAAGGGGGGGGGGGDTEVNLAVPSGSIVPDHFDAVVTNDETNAPITGLSVSDFSLNKGETAIPLNEAAFYEWISDDPEDNDPGRYTIYPVDSQLPMAGEYTLTFSRSGYAAASAVFEAAAATVPVWTDGGTTDGPVTLYPAGTEDITYGPETGIHTINGDILIEGNLSQVITIQNMTISGNLTINTPNATVNVTDDVTVTGDTNIQAVSADTFNSQGSHHGVIGVFGPASLNLTGNAGQATVSVNTTGQVRFAGSINVVQVVSDGVQITVAGGTINYLQVEENSAYINIVGGSLSRIAVNNTVIVPPVIIGLAPPEIQLVTGLTGVNLTVGGPADSSNSVVLDAGEILEVNSSAPEVAAAEVSGAGSNEIRVTPLAAGRATIDVQIKNSSNEVIKAGTFIVTIAPAAPAGGEVVITRPSAGEAAGQTKINIAAALEFRITNSDGSAVKQNWTPGISADRITQAGTPLIAGDRIEVRVRAAGLIPAGEEYVYNVQAGDIGQVDKTALTSAITAAQAKADAAADMVGTDPRDPGEVLRADLDALEAAIAAAEAVADNVAATVQQVAAAVAALNGAVDAFEASIQGEVEKTALTSAIATAQGKADAAVVGTDPRDPGEVLQVDLDTLEAAITAAEVVEADAEATVQEVADAVTALNAAVTEFDASVQGEVDKTALTSAITAAQVKAGSAMVGTDPRDPGEVLQADLDILEAAIATAQAMAADAEATVQEVADAVTALNAAVTEFEAAVQGEVDKTALTSAIAAAQDKVDHAVVGTDPRDPGEVLQADLDALTAAIAAAQLIADNAEAMVQEVTDAVTALNGAVTDFDASVQGEVDKTALLAAIATAEGKAENADVGTTPRNPGQVLQADLDALEAAIAAAEAVADNVAATVQQVADAVTALNAAITAFDNAPLPEMGGTVTIDGSTKFGETLTANISGLTYTGEVTDNSLSYRWQRGGAAIAGATGTAYILVQEDIGQTITATVTADGSNAAGSVTSAPTAAVEKADGPAAPDAPVLVGKTETTVTLTANPLVEFSRDGGSTWQDSEVFTGLTPETGYTFIARVRETDTHKASAAGDGTTVTTLAEFAGGSGTAEAPWQISEPRHLHNIRNYLGAAHSNKHFILLNDIDLAGYLGEDGPEYNEGKGWIPIGPTWGSEFKGELDGNGKTISNLTINRSNEDNIGLFGMTYYAVIRDLSLENVNISGKSYVGSIAGRASYGTIQMCRATGIVAAASQNGGGLAGEHGAGNLIVNCASHVTVTGAAWGRGGMAGNAHALSHFLNSYSTGVVTGSGSTIGGFIGYQDGGVGDINNCYYDTNTSGQSDTGKGEPKTTFKMIRGETFTGWDFDNVWAIDEGASYPYLYWQDGASIPRPDTIPGFNIVININPVDGGTVVGAGLHEENTEVTLTASANEGYLFVNWTEGGTEISTASTYTFTVTGDVEYTANFIILGAAVDIDNVLQIGENTTAAASTTEAGVGGWQSSNTATVSIDASTGVITALGAGTTTISYTVSDSGNYNSTEITVYPAAVIDNPAIAEVRVGQPNVTPAEFTAPAAGETITWQSGDETKAVVNAATGEITAAAAGDTTISYRVTEDATGRVAAKGELAITVQPLDQITGAQVDISEGSIVFGYKFFENGTEINYNEAHLTPYYLDKDNSIVTLKLGEQSVTKALTTLGISADGTKTYSSLNEVIVQWWSNPAEVFIPSHIELVIKPLEGQTTFWSEMTVSRELTADEILLLTPNSDATLAAFTVGGIDVTGLAGLEVSNPMTDQGAELEITDFTDFTGIAAAAADANAAVTVTVNGIPAADPVHQAVAENDVIVVTVVAEDGTTVRHYKVTAVLLSEVIPVGDFLEAEAGSDFIGVVYTRDGKIYYNEKAGGLWGVETEIGTGTEGRMAIDSSDNAHIAYTTNGAIGYRTFNGSAWSGEVLIASNNGGSCSKPDIAVDSNGYAHITYTDTDGNTFWYDNKPDIMYAVNTSGSFTNQVIFDGYYESLGGATYAGNYFNKGSYIALDSGDNYYIAAHKYNYYRWMSGTDKTYSIVVKSNLGTGSTTGSSTDVFDIYDLTANGDTIHLLYKQSTFKVSELVFSGAAISFINTGGLTGTSVSSVETDLTNVVVGGINSTKLQTHYNGQSQVYDGIVVKGTRVSVVNTGGTFNAIYSDNADSIIKLAEITRPLNTNATLAVFTAGGVDVTGLTGLEVTDPSVDAGAELEVADFTGFAGIGAAPADSNATVTVTLNGITIDEADLATQVLAENDVIVVVVVAEDGVTTKYYKLTVKAVPPAPAAETLVPMNGAPAADINPPTAVTFDTDVTVNDLSGITITYLDGVIQQVGNVAAVLQGDNRTLTIAHDTLNHNTTYTVTIPADAVRSGSTGNEAITWSFTTRDVISAVIVPEAADFYYFGYENVVTTINWVDAAQVTGIFVPEAYDEGYTLMGSEYIVTDSGDGTAVLAVKPIVLNDLWDNGEGIYSFVVSFDTGDPVTFAINVQEDTTPPEFAAGYPKTDNITETQFDLTVQTNEYGDAYFVVYDAGATPPSNTSRITAGCYDDGQPLPGNRFGEISLTPDTEAVITVSGLAVETAYDVYVVAYDSNGNATSIVKVAVTTEASLLAQTAAPVITLPVKEDHTVVTGTATAGAEIILSINGAPQAPVTAGVDGSWEVTGLTLQLGDWITVTAQSDGELVSEAASTNVLSMYA